MYEEEFGLAQAWNWSPDSRRIAFWQIDESKEPVVQLTDFSGRHETWDRIRIPQPGDTNPTAKIGVVDVKSGKRTWLVPDLKGEYYVPRIYWTSRPDTLAVVTLNRRQNEMRLYFFDVNTGGARQVLRETSDAWIDVYDFYAGVQDLLSFPEHSTEFFWLSDRDGFQHVYRYDYSGKLVKQVYTLERIAPLMDKARRNLRDLRFYNVRYKHADGHAGYPEGGPYDGILMAASATHVPDALKQQLAVGGRLVLPVGVEDQWLYVIDRSETGFTEQKCEPVRFVPLLPGLA